MPKNFFDHLLIECLAFGIRRKRQEHLRYAPIAHMTLCNPVAVLLLSLPPDWLKL